MKCSSSFPRTRRVPTRRRLRPPSAYARLPGLLQQEMPRITSRDNPRLKEAVRLIASSRERRKAGRCVLEGEHVVAAYCRRHGSPETLLIAEAALGRPEIQALQASVPAAQTLVVTPSAWAEFSQLPAVVGALAVVATPTPRS